MINSVSKRYPGVQALRDVSLRFDAGQVHGLVGENGAGKSTLMGVISGAVLADAGTVTLNGEDSPGGDPNWVREHQLAIVHQEPALLPDLTVAENMRLVIPIRKRPPISQQNRWAEEKLALWEPVARIAPNIPSGQLRPDERFVVEIARALATDPNVLVLDEPTEHLLETGVAVLLEQIKECVMRSVAVVYISHRIREVLEIADVVSVLRNGELRATSPANNLTEEDLVTLIVGRELGARFPAKTAAQHTNKPPALGVSRLKGTTFTDVSFTLAHGEILGFAGIEGQGQREVLRALAGLERTEGVIEINGKQVPTPRTPAAAESLGIAYLSNDRHREGILSGLSVRENVVLRALRGVSRGGVVRKHRERSLVTDAISRFGIKTPNSENPIESLSGGNQQKVMMGRILLSDANLLLVDEPSQGVDVGARAEIYAILRQATSQGAAVCVLSSDNAELEGLCDRAIVFSRGRVVREFEGDDVLERKITESAVTASGTRSRLDRPSAKSGAGILFRTRLMPWLVLAIALVALATAASSKSPFYMTQRNFSLVLPMLAILLLVGVGQQFALIVGGIDLSVGPLMSVIVVTASYILSPLINGIALAFGWLVLLAIAVAVGFVNWALVCFFKITPIIATLVTYTALQGVALVIRPTSGGSFNTTISDALQYKIGFVPVTLIAGIAIAIALEISLTRSTIGVKLRAAGSDPRVAATVGVRVDAMNLLAYIGAAVFAFLGGLLFLPISGSGNAAVGTVYTLSSIAAVVLGGASIFGGRGSFVGATLGAATVVQINTVVTFLGFTAYWQQYLLGGLTVVATAFYSKVGFAGGGRQG